jgi:hypothetical protein
VLTLTAYLDESGTHAGSPAVSVAGYLSTPEQWQVFEAEWLTALGDFGVPSFHMTDFANRAKPFAHWNESQRRERFRRLVEIINRHALFSVGHVVPTASFDAIFSDKAKRIVGGAYGLAATVCFLDAAKLLDPQFPSARIKYIFEMGAEGTGQVLKTFRQNSKDPDQRTALKLLSLQFESKEFVPLQAADILAYELSRHLPRQLGTNSRRPRVWHLKPLSGVQRIWGFMEDDELQKWTEILDLVDE